VASRRLFDGAQVELGSLPIVAAAASAAYDARIYWLEVRAQATVPSETVLECGVGAATADGSTASISLSTSIDAGVGAATAEGLTAFLGGAVTIDATPGAAVADGAQASIESETSYEARVYWLEVRAQATEGTTGQTIDCGVGAAQAAGASVALSGTLAFTVGAAIATGATASVLSGAAYEARVYWLEVRAQATVPSDQVVECGVGAAIAGGPDALFEVVTELACGVGAAVATGEQAGILSDTVLSAGVGAAVAAGLTAQTGGSTVIDAQVAAAVANGSQVQIGSAQVLGLGVADALAQGSTAQIVAGPLDVTIDCTLGAAIAAGLRASVGTPLALYGVRGTMGRQTQGMIRRNRQTASRTN
jgi:hypothetical protein